MKHSSVVNRAPSRLELMEVLLEGFLILEVR